MQERNAARPDFLLGTTDIKHWISRTERSLLEIPSFEWLTGISPWGFRKTRLRGGALNVADSNAIKKSITERIEKSVTNTIKKSITLEIGDVAVYEGRPAAERLSAVSFITFCFCVDGLTGIV
jgi:hypothetical protein